jgi:hypothetical protein
VCSHTGIWLIFAEKPESVSAFEKGMVLAPEGGTAALANR